MTATHTATLDAEHVLRVTRHYTHEQVFHVQLRTPTMPLPVAGEPGGFPAAVVQEANIELHNRGYEAAERGGHWSWNPHARQLQMALTAPATDGKDQATGVRTVLAAMTPPPHRASVVLMRKAGGGRVQVLLTASQLYLLRTKPLTTEHQLAVRSARNPSTVLQIPARNIAWVELEDVPLSGEKES